MSEFALFFLVRAAPSLKSMTVLRFKSKMTFFSSNLCLAMRKITILTSPAISFRKIWAQSGFVVLFFLLLIWNLLKLFLIDQRIRVSFNFETFL